MAKSFGDVKVNAAYADVVEQIEGATGGPVTWASITGKPTTFAPITGTGATQAAPGNHVHTVGSVTGLQAALDGKASSSHTHTIANVTSLQGALDGKAATTHTHTFTALTGAVSGAAGANLQEILDDLQTRLAAVETP